MKYERMPGFCAASTVLVPVVDPPMCEVVTFTCPVDHRTRPQDCYCSASVTVHRSTPTETPTGGES